METIYKYQLTSSVAPLPSVCIMMFRSARILTLQKQDEIICLWAEVNTDNSWETRQFEIVGTGNERYTQNRKYIGTVQEAAFVWHIYEIINEAF
jgi:hypothetical protein